MEEFTRIDAHAVHSAMVSAAAEAKEREEKMPSSASALLRHAADLYTVREKILDRLPKQVRDAYPPHK